MNLPIIMCSIVGAIILKNGIEFSIHKPEQNIVTFEECQHFLRLYCIVVAVADAVVFVVV